MCSDRESPVWRPLGVWVEAHMLFLVDRLFLVLFYKLIVLGDHEHVLKGQAVLHLDIEQLILWLPFVCGMC